VARRILDCEERVSLDLGLSEVVLAYEGKRVVLPDGSTVSLDDIEAIASRQGAVFFPRDGEVFQVAISDGHFYKLVPTDGAPASIGAGGWIRAPDWATQLWPALRRAGIWWSRSSCGIRCSGSRG
jgi:predicted methyltransferase